NYSGACYLAEKSSLLKLPISLCLPEPSIEASILRHVFSLHLSPWRHAALARAKSHYLTLLRRAPAINWEKRKRDRFIDTYTSRQSSICPLELPTDRYEPTLLHQIKVNEGAASHIHYEEWPNVVLFQTELTGCLGAVTAIGEEECTRGKWARRKPE